MNRRLRLGEFPKMIWTGVLACLPWHNFLLETKMAVL